MRVFVLGTGRTGSTSLSKACEHMTNYTVSHERHKRELGPQRLDYPDGHIEIDNRLSWMLGRLHDQFGDDAYYVHLRRDPDEVARSYAERWRQEQAPLARRVRQALRRPYREWTSLVEAYAYGILQRTTFWGADERRAVARDMVDTIESNVEHFLAARPRRLTIDIADGEAMLAAFWQAIGAEGDYDLAVQGLRAHHNAGVPPARRR